MLQNSQAIIIWQTNTAKSNNNRYKLQLEDNGYISIINANGTSIWKSSSSSSSSSSSTPVLGIILKLYKIINSKS